MKPMTMRILKINASLLLILAAFPILCQQAPAIADRVVAKPYHMLVLGDSITWGQGLKKDHKAWYQVKTWLEKTTGRPVIERVEAHSGAVIDRSSTDDRLIANDAEVNAGLPSVNDQVENALQSYVDGSRVELVLISGCANDIGAQTFLNASSTAELDRMTEEKCEPLMERLLRKVTASFPAAQVIVVGYYPFFSENTRNDFVTRVLARRLVKTNPGAEKIDARKVFERLADNSREWYRASNKSLGEAVQKINSELGTERVIFAGIQFPPEYSFAAKQTRLWSFNRSPFRMMLVFLSFGKIHLPTNDEMRSQRKAACDQAYEGQPNETAEQNRERRNRRLLCRYAALGHPNRKGAMLYADAIRTMLKTTLAISPP